MLGDKYNPMLWKNLYKDILPQKFNLYVEPFAGTFGFYRMIKPKKAVFNDINKDLYEKAKVKYEGRDIIFHNEDYQIIIDKYNFEDTFFFIDAPYVGKENYYKNHNFLTQENHIQLSEKVKTIKGKFIVCYQKNELINQLYKDFNVYEYKLKDDIFHRNEIAITNYVH
jgi:DNA adenine methylase